MALLDDIVTRLESQGVGTFGTDLFASWIPDQPDTCLAVFETGGFEADLHNNVRYPTIQVRGRAKSYPVARAKLQAAMDNLHGLTETTINGTRYLLIAAEQEPTSIGRDDSNRPELTQNFRIMKEA